MAWHMEGLNPYDHLGSLSTELDYPHLFSENLEVENNLDPDDGNSLLCGACRLPIFSTPFITTVDNIILHDPCAHLPEKLEDHVLHPTQPLLRHENQPTSTTTCTRCRSMCGTTLYKCGDSQCKIQLDVSCAWTVKILHRSHVHRLTAIRGASFSFICAICGTQHGSLSESRLSQVRKSWDLTSYMCSFCDFWIHPDCALLPNAIILLHQVHRHKHPLLLEYDLDLSSGPRFAFVKCAICDARLENLGFYFCGTCRYYAHVKCCIWSPGGLRRISDPPSFKPVLIREAQLPNLLQLPMPDEHTSVMRHIIHTITNDDGGGESTTNNYDHDQSRKLFAGKHQHPLIFHDDDDHIARVCNACVRSISPPFYSCSECSDFFLHSCCAHLPHILSKHSIHDSRHPLLLFSKVDTPFNIFWCKGCDTKSNGFAYACKKCDFHLDVVCAFMPDSISHNTHGKGHILYPVYRLNEDCNCCGSLFLGFYSGFGNKICYECTICRNFRLHYKCALLPDTITHKFDRHPLKLITTSKLTTTGGTQTQTLPDDRRGYSPDQEELCEICEGDMDTRQWYYGCGQCDQSFHTNCIPCLDYLSNIKFGFSVRVRCHDCPVSCVRAMTVYGYRCGYCQETIGRESIRRDKLGDPQEVLEYYPQEYIVD